MQGLRLAGRLLLALWLALTLSFCALRLLPGDALGAKLRAVGTPPAEIDRQRQLQGLDRPMLSQYLHYWGDLLQGDMGRSLITREAVSQMLAVRLLPTLTLALTGLSVAIAAGLCLGTLAALPALPEMPTLARPLSQIAQTLLTLALAAPVYWTATLVIMLLSTQLGWLPAADSGSLAALLLPALVLGFHTGAAIGRVVESTIRSSAGAAFVQNALAKGLPPEAVLLHVLRVALVPVLSVVALQAGFLLSGTVILEVIFTRRGLGTLLYQSVLEQDYPVVQGVVLLSALAYTLTRLLADALRHIADPRLRVVA